MNSIRFDKVKNWTLLAASAICMTIGAAQAATWPSRPIKVVVPFPPGATPDIMARLVGDRLSVNLGQPVIIENKPGGSGLIAIGAVQNAVPDGYTLLLADTGHLAINPALMKDLPYDPMMDFLPVSRFTEQDFSVIVRADSPDKTIGDLLERSKKKEGGLTYGTSGVGSVHHIGSERLKILTGAHFMHVPYKGTIQSVPALLSGEIDFMISSATPVMGQWKSGKIRILARGSDKRSPLMPDVPTLRESGIPLTISITLGMLAPKGTPSEVVQRLSTEVNKVLESPEVKQKVATQDFTVRGSTPQAFTASIREQLQEYKNVIQETGITAR